MEACIILGTLASAAGRSLVKALKHLMGPWCLAQADPHSETAKNASAAFRQVFPGIKSKEAVALYHIQVRNTPRIFATAARTPVRHLRRERAPNAAQGLAQYGAPERSQHIYRQAVRVPDRACKFACRSLTS